MKCNKCGTEFEGNFCTNCGEKAVSSEERCPNCGGLRRNYESFCPDCGYQYHRKSKPADSLLPRIDSDAPPMISSKPKMPLTVAVTSRAVEYSAGYGLILSFLSILPLFIVQRLAPIDWVIVIASFLLTFLIVAFVSAYLSTRAYGARRKARRLHRGWMKIYRPTSYIIEHVIYCLVCSALVPCIALILSSSFDDPIFPSDGSWIFVYILIPSIYPLSLGVAQLIWFLSNRNKINEAFYGTSSPTKKQPLTVSRESLSYDLRKFHSDWEAFWAYKFCKRKLEQGDTVHKQSAATFAKVYSVGSKVGVTILSLALLLLIFLGSLSYIKSVFRIDKISLIAVGCDQNEVTSTLSSPYNGNSSRFDSTDYVWRYYDQKYTSLLRQNDSFDPDDIEDMDDLENAFNDALALENKLQTQYHAYIEVYFRTDSVTGTTYVSSIFYDPACTEEDRYETRTSNDTYEILLAEIERNARTATVVYTANYTDGSYLKALTTAYLASGESTATLGGRNVEQNKTFLARTPLFVRVRQKCAACSFSDILTSIYMTSIITHR